MREPAFIVQRYILRDCALSWLAVSAVLFAIMIANASLKLLSQFADGHIGIDLIAPLLLVTSLNLLTAILPFGLFLGVMMGLGRFYQDSEMIAMLACGVTPEKILQSIAALGLIAFAVTFSMSTLVAPWAEHLEYTLRSEQGTEKTMGLLQSGKFVEARDGKIAFFAESVDDDGEMHNVFLRQLGDDNSQSVEFAAVAQYHKDKENNSLYLVFERGQRVVMPVNNATQTHNSYAFIDFARHGINIPNDKSAGAFHRVSAQSTHELIQSNNLQAKAELQWRIGVPITVLLLSILAVPLSHTSPRQGRYGKIAVAVIVYIAYANLLILARKWISVGQIPAWMGLWWVHLLVLLGIIILWRRIYAERI